MKNVTIFTIPKRFTGIFDTIQRNAITSWTLLEPTPEIILCGNDIGVAEFAKEKGLLHIPDVEISEKGTPYLGDTFSKVHEAASNHILIYSNCDMIFMSDLVPTIEKVKDRFSGDFLIVGQRFDMNMSRLIDFVHPNWEQDLLSNARIPGSGTYHSVFGIDYFIFRTGSWQNFPPFIVGRPGWDNWFVSKALQLGHSVIDATKAVFAIHQNHDFSHLAGGQQEARHGVEAKYNTTKGSQLVIRSIADANYKFVKERDLSDEGIISNI